MNKPDTEKALDYLAEQYEKDYCTHQFLRETCPYCQLQEAQQLLREWITFDREPESIEDISAIEYLAARVRAFLERTYERD